MARSGALPPEPADILKLELLTGRVAAKSAAYALRKSIAQWTWTLPAARSKNKRPRVTPLVGVARQIIEARLSTAPGTAVHRRDRDRFDRGPRRPLPAGASQQTADRQVHHARPAAHGGDHAGGNGHRPRSCRRGGRPRGGRQRNANAGPSLRSHRPDRAQDARAARMGQAASGDPRRSRGRGNPACTDGLTDLYLDELMRALGGQLLANV